MSASPPAEAPAGHPVSDGMRRLLPVYLPVIAVAVVVAALRAGGYRGLSALDWLPGMVSLLVATGYVYRASRAAWLDPAGRRFWRYVAFLILVSSGGAWALEHAADRAETVPAVLAKLLLGLMALAAMMWLVALLRLPLLIRGRGDRIRIGHDVATVLVGAGAFLWYFLIAPKFERGGGLAVVATPAAVSLVCLLAILGIVRLVRGGSVAVDRLALAAFGVQMVLGAAGTGVSATLNDPRLIGVRILIGVLAGMLQALAGVLQLGGEGRTAAAMTARRPYSLMPYVAVLAVDFLLVRVSVNLDDPHMASRLPIVVVGAVVTSGIVASRQLLAFRDNAALVALLRAKQDLLREQATHDALTGLPNRALFAERLPALFGVDEPAALLLIDLDDFKIVNDTLGHQVGDALLIEIGRRLRSAVRPGDLVARLGGDEFAVLLPGIDDQRATGVAARILAALDEPVVVDDQRLAAAASIGIADLRGADGPQELLRHADVAMYAAKRVGKNRYALHDLPVEAVTGPA